MEPIPLHHHRRRDRSTDVVRLFRAQIILLLPISPPIDAPQLSTTPATTHKFSKYLPLAVEDFDNTFAINARGTFLCCREAANRIKCGGEGRIICLTSSLVASLWPGCVAYTASKAAVEAMVKILAKELKGTGITVNAVAPGLVAMEMFFAGTIEEVIKKTEADCPFGRLGEEEPMKIWEEEGLEFRGGKGEPMRGVGGILEQMMVAGGGGKLGRR
ncbi:Rossmann-fold superfamily protein [Perilla frutescens var. hirtella]|nr:Rossmann-fold superfamily protein [Perilla frutescens var. hirtella]